MGIPKPKPVAVPGRNQTLFCYVFRPCYHIRSVVAQYFWDSTDLFVMYMVWECNLCSLCTVRLYEEALSVLAIFTCSQLVKCHLFTPFGVSYKRVHTFSLSAHSPLPPFLPFPFFSLFPLSPSSLLSPSLLPSLLPPLCTLCTVRLYDEALLVLAIFTCSQLVRKVPSICTIWC